MVVEIDARPASIPSLIILFLIQLRSSCTWKNEVLPPSKLSLLNTCEDQQKNSSSFANVSWCPVKSGHDFHAWSVPLWFVCNRSLFLAAVCDEWALPPDQNSLVPVVFDSIVLKKNHWKLSQNCMNWDIYWLREGPELMMEHCLRWRKSSTHEVSLRFIPGLCGRKYCWCFNGRVDTLLFCVACGYPVNTHI